MYIIGNHFLHVVKEQILDMSEILKAVNEKIDCLTNQVVSLTRQLAIVTAENITLKQKIIVLEARLAEYETPKDSHNSSTPPSKESIKAHRSVVRSYSTTSTRMSNRVLPKDNNYFSISFLCL